MSPFSVLTHPSKEHHEAAFLTSYEPKRHQKSTFQPGVCLARSHLVTLTG